MGLLSTSKQRALPKIPFGVVKPKSQAPQKGLIAKKAKKNGDKG